MNDNQLMKLKLAETLTRILRDRRMTLREVSESSGVSISTISEWSSGRIPKNPLQVAKIAKTLRVSMYSLLFGVEDDFGKAKSPVTFDVKGDRTYEITIRRVLKR
jgi:transcriptional regulator with XRE-family HTH domain